MGRGRASPARSASDGCLRPVAGAPGWSDAAETSYNCDSPSTPCISSLGSKGEEGPVMLSPIMSPARVRTELSRLGIQNPGIVYCQLAPAAWVELALSRGEGELADNGAFVANTGTHTGRSPKDRFLVAEPSAQADIAWGPINRPMEPAVFERLL